MIWVLLPNLILSYSIFNFTPISNYPATLVFIPFSKNLKFFPSWELNSYFISADLLNPSCHSYYSLTITFSERTFLTIKPKVYIQSFLTTSDNFNFMDSIEFSWLFVVKYYLTALTRIWDQDSRYLYLLLTLYTQYRRPNMSGTELTLKVHSPQIYFYF